MNRIRAEQTDLYESVFASLDQYSAYSPGERFVAPFLEMTGTHMRGSVLDAGTGSGKGALALARAGFTVTLCDVVANGLIPEARALPFVEACLWSNLKRAVGFREWVYCCDVLEHIPPTFTMLVVSRLLEVARRGLFLSIALTPDNFGVFIGEPLHQTVQPFEAWRDQLSELGHLVEARDLLTTGLYLLAPRAEGQ